MGVEKAIELVHAGDWGGVESECRAALERNPRLPEALQLLGIALFERRAFLECLDAFENAIDLRPDWAALHENRGLALLAVGREKEAEESLERGLSLAPESASLNIHLARLHLRHGRLHEAARHFLRGRQIVEENAALAFEYANTLRRLGKYREAVGLLRTAVKRAPGNREILLELAHALRESGDPAGAVSIYSEAIRTHPMDAVNLVNLGTAYRDLGRLDEAANSYRLAIDADRGLSAGYAYLGNIHRERGNAREAVRLYRQSLAVNPDASETRRQLLLAQLYDEESSMECRFQESCTYMSRHGAQAAFPRLSARIESGRRLRVGYLTSDLYSHPVARSVGPIIANHDRSKFEVFVYSDALRSDDVSERIRQSVDHWQNLTGADDESVARLIRRDQIDILVCVAGRFDGNRPLVATWNPASVQISLGDVGSFGSRSFDCIFADRVLVPRGTLEPFSERPFRLPTYFLHEPIADAPTPTEPPSLSTAAITFGCLNNPAKLSDRVVELWAKLLATTEHSRLLLKYKNYYDVPSIVGRIRGIAQGHGVDPGRVIFESGLHPIAVHLDTYNSIDVALDPFPFSGSTASFEALWMGVPIVTMPGSPMVSRWTAAMLSPLGFGDWIVDSPEGYLRVARSVAADTASRAEWRRTLRKLLMGSSLCDVVGRTRQIERAYRWIWNLKVCGHAPRMPSRDGPPMRQRSEYLQE